MHFNRISDISLNICLPLLLGCLIYSFETDFVFPAFIRNFLPDGLWAYAFISGILIIWERQINKTWILLLFLFTVCFEMMQYKHLISGTGDLKDVLTYYLFFILALLLNNFFKNITVPQSQTTRS